MPMLVGLPVAERAHAYTIVLVRGRVQACACVCLPIRVRNPCVIVFTHLHELVPCLLARTPLHTPTRSALS
eukprot:588472-Pleurochrysis_carterae.AAC.2